MVFWRDTKPEFTSKSAKHHFWHSRFISLSWGVVSMLGGMILYRAEMSHTFQDVIISDIYL